MLEIKLKSTNQSIEISGVGINFQSNDNVINTKIDNQMISYNFSIAATKNNLRNLKIPNVIESSDVFEEFEVFIIIDNVVESAAVLTIQEVTKRYIKISLLSSSFDDAFLDLLMVDNDFGDAIDIGPDFNDILLHVEDVNSKNYPDTSHVFPAIYNPEFYNNVNTTYLGLVNFYLYFLLSSDPYLEPNDDTSGVKNRNVLVPYFFLVWIIKTLFERQGITVRGSFINHPEIQKLLVHNNQSLDDFTLIYHSLNALKTTGFAIDLNPVQLVCDDDSTPPYTDPDSIYNTSNGEITLLTEGQLVVKLFHIKAKADFNPIPTTKYLVVKLKINGAIKYQTSTKINSSISSGFNVELQTNVTAANVSSGHKATIEFSVIQVRYFSGYTNTTTWYGDVYPGINLFVENQLKEELNIYKKEILPSQHLPKKTARNFINSIISDFKLIPYYNKNEKVFYLDFFQNVITDKKYDDITKHQESFKITSKKYTGFNVGFDFDSDELFDSGDVNFNGLTNLGNFNTISSLPEPISIGYMAFVINVNAYFITIIDGVDIVWIRVKEKSEYLYEIGDGGNEIKLNYAPFCMDNNTIVSDISGEFPFFCPKINEQGTSTMHGIGENNFKNKLLIWHGMKPILNEVDWEDILYPFASSYNYDVDGTEIGDLSLKLDDSITGVYELFLKSYFNFLMNTKVVKHTLTPDFKNPLSYNFSRKQLIFNQRYLTNNMKIKISQEGVETIEVENFKI